MTVIVAIKDEKNNRIILGTDKLVNYAYTKDVITSKIVDINIPVIDGYGELIRNDKCFIAISGAAYMISFLEYGFEAPSFPNNMEFIEYLHKHFLPCLRTELVDRQLTEEYNQQFDSGCAFVIVYNDEIFNIGVNFGVFPIKEYVVEGAGYIEALASIYTSSKLNPNIGAVKQVELAIETALHHNIYCGGESDIRIIDY